jgi:NAD(P)-dependent dehydrogenase (short-subunit alcohol dehydrogenase family)
MNYNPFSLEGKTILVTGASSGIGKAIAIECAKLGATLVINGRNEERLKSTFDELDTSLGQQHQMIIADLTTEEGIEQLISKKIAFDGVSSNAGIVTGNKPIKFIETDDLLNVINTNTISHITLAKQLFKKKLLNKNASYVFTASIGGTVSHGPGNTIYGVSKSAIDSFMKYAAIEFATRGIRCNSVCPGMIETPMINLDALTDEDKAKDAEKYLLKRYGKPEEVAHLHAFLLSDASSFITGDSIIIDGGYTVNH